MNDYLSQLVTLICQTSYANSTSRSSGEATILVVPCATILLMMGIDEGLHIQVYVLLRVNGNLSSFFSHPSHIHLTNAINKEELVSANS